MEKNSDSASEAATGMGRLKEQSLKAAGYAYLVGDAALVTAGILEGSKSTAITGALYGTGGLVLARYGNPKIDKRLQLLYQDLGDYFKAKGIEIPKGNHVDAAMLARQGGIIEHIEHFLYKHPSQVLNSLFAVGGGQLMYGGVKDKRPWKTASGALVAAGALAGLLIKEKNAEAEEERPSGFFDKASRWVQDKPLRIPGYLYMANNITMTIDAVLERQKHPKQFSKLSSGPAFQLLMVASYIVANGLLAISNKNNAASKNADEQRAITQDLERAAAEVIAAQPRELQQPLLQEVASYLSAQGRTNIPAEKLASAMQDMVNEYTQPVEKTGDWVKRIAINPMPALSK